MYSRWIVPIIWILGVLQCIATTTIKVGVVLMSQAKEPFDMERIGPALSIAMENARDRFDINFEAEFRNYTRGCPFEPPVGILSELYHKDKIKAIIGPACSKGIMASGRLAAYLHVPMVTGLGDLVLKRPGVDAFDSLTILSYDLRKLSYSVSAIMNYYNWKHTAILYDQTYAFFEIGGSNLVNDFRLSSVVERPYDLPFVPSTVTDFGELLLEAKNYARVFIIFCFADMFRDILYRAYQLGMADGEYVFITMERFLSDATGFYFDFLRELRQTQTTLFTDDHIFRVLKLKAGSIDPGFKSAFMASMRIADYDEKDYAVTKAYESVLILTLSKPDNPEYEAFNEKVKKRAKVKYGYEFPPDEKVNYIITAFYDSVIYLAMAYKTQLDEGGDINDGMAVAQKLWNTTFSGITGPVKTDSIGVRIADFDMFDMKSGASKEFQLVGRFSGATQNYVEIRGVDIVWPKGLPNDEPKCGFRGDKCITEKEDNTVLAVVVCLTVIAATTMLLVVIVLVTRKIKTEQELGKKTWLIKHSEVQIRKTRLNDSFLSKSHLTLDTTNKDHLDTGFTRTGLCRSNIVAIRKLHLQSLEVTRNVAVEFRQMQVLSHGNLAKFVGACLEPGYMYLLMEYCPRGSLQDMLQNDNIELDWVFRYSLISDIIRGMCYLHSSSQMKVHGQLSSTNCVIDSRFALKLTDFGPRLVLSRDRDLEKRRSDRPFNFAKLLWTAPEHLRENGGVIGYSQKGDVYAFGIILQEISMRAKPFEGNEVDVSEIIKRVAAARSEVYRPIVPPNVCSTSLISMMNSCWTEEPQSRPNFSELEESFEKMRAGKTTNIMDNLLQRMSNYADNLETLAAERTKAYLEEKQKVEELLHRLLPPSVAKQLELGRSVTPESYECVTIYFSDIVEFTSLCSMSSPIEVVDLLNDLYTSFDNEINKYNVYKVETIGDAYMCVSGLPERNGKQHVVEVSNMSLTILETVKGFRVKHIPDHRLRVRIGIHSGPVVAGVVGQTMPRYCLFGDAVNTASRMESTSEPLKIQLSSTTKALLDHFPEFIAIKRGEIEVKGKGLMTTYWLGSNSKKMDQKDKLMF